MTFLSLSLDSDSADQEVVLRRGRGTVGD